jgi:hypothetical protein
VLSIAAGCTRVPTSAVGRWLGEARIGDGSDRLEIVVDSAERSAALTMRGWNLRGDTALRAPGDRLRFGLVRAGDTLELGGVRVGDYWTGHLRRGADSAPFRVRRLSSLSDSGWSAMVGIYRTDQGSLVGIAPFSEFGDRPMFLDYATGRLAPLYPVTASRLLLGAALIAPVFPADSLEVSPPAGGPVSSIRYSLAGGPPITARRIATRDEEVSFSSGGVVLSGTLTLPVTPAPSPGLVLVHGSNALTRDAFGPWSRFFAAHGFAVLADDKRGTGRSSGDWRQADFRTLAQDVLAGVRYLAARSEVRPDRIGLWGASQAGWIMPIVAAEAPSEIAFMAVHAGTGTTVREQGTLNLRYELRASGLSESEIALGVRYHELDDRVTTSGRDWDELQRFYQRESQQHPWLWPPQPPDAWFRTYYRMLMPFDPSDYWRRVSCPVLLFFGELDVNVPPDESWPPIERQLSAGGNRRVTMHLLPRANHLFLEARTGASGEYPGLSRFVPGYFDRLAGWLTEQAR